KGDPESDPVEAGRTPAWAPPGSGVPACGVSATGALATGALATGAPVSGAPGVRGAGGVGVWLALGALATVEARAALRFFSWAVWTSASSLCGRSPSSMMLYGPCRVSALYPHLDAPSRSPCWRSLRPSARTRQDSS